MKIGLFSGSFDPFTFGHLHILKTATKLFDLVYVAVVDNHTKTRRFDKETMKIAIEKTIEAENLKNVKCMVSELLPADIAKQVGASFLIRGVRNAIDYDFEERLAMINEEISGGIDTIFVRAGDFGYVSSSMVVELMRNKKDISKFVPKEVRKIIEN